MKDLLARTKVCRTCGDVAPYPFEAGWRIDPESGWLCPLCAPHVVAVPYPIGRRRIARRVR